MTEPNGFATRVQLFISALTLAAPAFAGIVYLYVENARTHEKLLETETQLCAIEQMRNMQHINDLRTISVLWQQVFKTPYPVGGVYTPTICNRGNT